MKRSGTSAIALPATALVASIWLVVACAVGSPTSPAPLESVNQPATLVPVTSKPTPSQEPTPTPTPTTTSRLHPSPPPALEPTPSPTQTSIPTPTVKRNGDEPTGSLLVGNANPVIGWEGSYCWQDVCADVGNPPDKDTLPSVSATASDQLTFAIDPVAGVFYDWHVDYTSGHGQPRPLASGDPFDPDAKETDPPMRDYVTFDAPPAGDWTLTVSIHFVEGGDAIYAWHVTVA
jgi:hypothetical protein